VLVPPPSILASNSFFTYSYWQLTVVVVAELIMTVYSINVLVTIDRLISLIVLWMEKRSVTSKMTNDTCIDLVYIIIMKDITRK